LIYVISIGGDMPFIRSLDVPIEVKTLSNKNANYFQENKTYISEIEAENLIYLDTDTIVVGKIDKIFEKSDCKIIARADSSYEKGKYFDKKKWMQILKEYGARSGPLLNSGFVIFKEESHRLIGKYWKSILKIERKKMKKKGEIGFNNRSTTEQMSLSISALKKLKKIGAMSKKDHIYGWNVSPSEVTKKCGVYHTGSRGGRHLKYASYLSRKIDIPLWKPIISSPANPLFIKLQGYHLGYFFKHYFNPPEE
jgi:hypothetical protein